MDQPTFKPSEYAARRTAALASLPPGGLLLLPTNPERQMSADVPYPYRGHTDVLYLAGYPEKDCVLALHRPANGGADLFAMFVQV